MSGHSKWATTKHRKAAQDSKRSAMFSKLSRIITVAAKQGGDPNPENNASLAAAIAKAKGYSMPKDKIKTAIDKAFGSGKDAANYETVVYEGYGPAGVAVLCEALTDNRNRTAPEVRHLLDKYGKGLGATGCVSWSFDKKGVIVLDAEDLDEDTVMMDALDAGADDYLGKPFDSRELLARGRANLRRQAPIEELVVLRYGDLVYDTKALLLACGREEIAVSKKLGLMIELFMKSKGQALARATLFARVWGADADVEEAILDNYIGFFRRRLAQIHSKMSLRTVRGVGYALVEEKEGR